MAPEEAAFSLLKKLLSNCLYQSRCQHDQNSKEKPDMALNLVTTVKGYDYLGATLELLEIPYTGTNIPGSRSGNKYLMHALRPSTEFCPRFQSCFKSPLTPPSFFPFLKPTIAQ